MKVCVTCIIFALLLAFTACGRGENDAPERPTPIMPQSPANEGASVSPIPPQGGEAVGTYPPAPMLRIADIRPNTAGIPIRWGFNTTMFDSLFQMENAFRVNRRGFEELAIQAFLSRYFNVQLEGVLVTDEMLHEGDVPDIFLAPPANAFYAGIARAIPEEMIRRYAPNYAALLDVHNGWNVSRAADGQQTALNTFDIHYRDLPIFSVYRLEWLEELDIGLPFGGDIVQVADGVYFSAASFTYHDFLWIMDAFSRPLPNPYRHPAGTWSENILDRARNNTLSMEINLLGDIHSAIAPIMGMFGVNKSIMEEDGRAIPFFASTAYRDALIFLESLIARDAVFIYGGGTQHSTFVCQFFRIGWAAVRTQDLYNVIHTARNNDPSRRFLITPPEDGGTGFRGVGLAQSAGMFNPQGLSWAVSNHVSDDTLARILNIFDTISFDREWFTLTNFGFSIDSPHYDPQLSAFNMIGSVEGKARLVWEGTPYDSTVTFLREPTVVIQEGLFSTGIFDGNTWERRFFAGFDAVNNFAHSSAGQQLHLLPARQDTVGEFTAQRAYLDNRYAHTLLGFNGIVNQFLLRVLHRQIDVTSGWDSYIATLNQHGLQEYINLFSQFPIR
ncbi:MAG: hypothetical protein FWC16_06790 [Defluviitaleaceae bacterium]|nr:hypothetical protein [Defluviitaleaceae bacterium]MCL2274617.1 hypothetical protein [Defluviitaleaceae bacterium]